MAICPKCQITCHKHTLLLYARGLPSNTSMPAPTVLTVPNHSSITLSACKQLCNKLHIGYNRTRQIYSKNCSFLVHDNHLNLIHPYLFRPNSPPQTASASNQPFCHSANLRTYGYYESSITILLRWDRRTNNSCIMPNFKAALKRQQFERHSFKKDILKIHMYQKKATTELRWNAIVRASLLKK